MISPEKKDINTYLKRNEKLVVKLLTESTAYDSRVEDITDKELFIQVPTNKGKPMRASKGAVLSISILTKGGRISFDTRVLGFVSSPFQMLSVDRPKSYRNEQLRQYYRIPVDININFFHGNMDKLNEMQKTGTLSLLEGGLIELSGGGGQIISEELLAEGDIIVVDLNPSLPNTGMIECKVVRLHDKPGERKFYSFSFTELSEQKRDNIIKYVFRRQMELRKTIL